MGLLCRGDSDHMLVPDSLSSPFELQAAAGIMRQIYAVIWIQLQDSRINYSV